MIQKKNEKKKKKNQKQKNFDADCFFVFFLFVDERGLKINEEDKKEKKSKTRKLSTPHNLTSIMLCLVFVSEDGYVVFVLFFFNSFPSFLLLFYFKKKNQSLFLFV
eukprot:PhF_6_TR41603/c0_g1_i1/m.63046